MNRIAYAEIKQTPKPETMYKAPFSDFKSIKSGIRDVSYINIFMILFWQYTVKLNFVHLKK